MDVSRDGALHTAGWGSCPATARVRVLAGGDDSSVPTVCQEPGEREEGQLGWTEFRGART